MLNLRKWMEKDKHMIIRGSIVMVVLVVLCATIFTHMLMNFARASVEARTADMAAGFAAQFEQAIRSEFSNLDAAAQLIREDASREELFVRAFSDSNDYSEAGVLWDGYIRHSDGSIRPLEYEMAYIYSVDGVPRGRFLTAADGSILFCAAIDEVSELAVRYDPDELADMLRTALEKGRDFAIYNASTGVYLVNCTEFTGGGYYDALLSLNENGSAAGLLNDETTIARVDSADGGLYIAQQRTGVRPWNVALMIPEAEVGAYTAQLKWMPYAVLAAALLLISMHSLFVFLNARRLHVERRIAERALEDNERMLSNLAWETDVTLFIYRRGQDGPMSCFDGLGLFGEGSGVRQLTSLRAIEEACGLNEADAERLHERLLELSSGGATELILHGALRDREVRRLCFTLNAYSTNDSVILCTVRDGTQEQMSQNRADAEQSYLEANMPRSAAVWTINVTRNRWRCVHMQDPRTMGALGPLEKVGWRDFTADLNDLLRVYLHPADYAVHSSKMSIPSIAGFYRSGRTEIDLDYRVRVAGPEDFEWHRMQVHLYSDPENADILANLYVFNVDVEKNAELERGEHKRIFKKTLRALSGIYYALYYVDLDNDLCYAAKAYDGEVTTRLCTPYRETFDSYIDSVHPDDRAEVRKMLDSFNIRQTFVEGSRFQRREYRRRSGDGYRWAAIIIQPARYENGRIKDVVVALRNLVGTRPDLDLE